MIKAEKECTGCMACRNICPVNAIGQIIDPRGYVMPAVNEAVCIGCGRCDEVCPLLADRLREEKRHRPAGAYAVYHRSEEVVRKSSSGGAFYALASCVIGQGGIVFGCVYDAKQKTAYLTDTDRTPLEALLTSKYVESYIGYGMQRVREQLENGRKVLFCGTPCQAAGLRCFLGREYPNLLLVDFTCGAVSAQGYLSDYLTALEHRYRSQVKRISFRDKHYQWGQYCFCAEFENGKLYRRTAMSDPYFFCFLRSSMQRLCCHGCLFSDCHFSDVILADFWRCDQFAGIDRNGRRGLSLVLAMTEKGQKALEEIREQVHAEAVDVEKASYNLCARPYRDEKYPEILSDQMCAKERGVASLRRRLLDPKTRIRFAVRQFVMDHPKMERFFPHLRGDGQIVR